MAEEVPITRLHPRPDFETTPERIKLQRDAVTNCVNTMRLPNNLEQFQAAAEQMFAAFDMATDDTEYSTGNKNAWKQRYEEWHDDNYHSSDIEFRGPDQMYANVYFDSEKLPEREKEFTLVSPGACSLPIDENIKAQRKPTDQFYYEFEEAIGIDDLRLRQNQPHHLFVVSDNGKYKRINALSPKLAHFALKHIRNYTPRQSSRLNRSSI